MRVTGGKCTLPTIRIWHTTPLTAPSQRIVHTNPRSAADAISTAQDYHPNVWSNSSSGIGSASTPALCNNRSCPASALRFAVWSNSSSGIASKTAFRAASRCANSISSGGDRAGCPARVAPKSVRTVFGRGALLPVPGFRPACATTCARHGDLGTSTPK